MELAEQQKENGFVVMLKGRLDVNTSPSAQTRLLQVIEEGKHKLVLDLSSLEYVSSAGLRVFMLVAKKIKTVNGKLALCGLKPNVHELFEIAGFLPLVPIYGSQPEALNSLS
jgi:anti-anti-sigma factor